MKKLFTIKKKKLLTIFLEENEFEEIDCSTQLEKFKKFIKKMDDNYLFLDKDGVTIEIQNENDFTVEKIIADEKIKIKKLDNNIIIMLEN